MPLRIKKLSLRRGNRLLIKDLSVELQKGESLLLTGPNGVGKTTFIRALAGFIAPFSGEISYKAQDHVTDIEPDSLHYIGHKNGLRASLTVLENLEFWAEFYGASRPVKEVMELFSLTTLMDIPAGYLSAGQKRRLGLARLVMVKRPIWLLDEPTVSLDKRSVNLLAETARDHIEDGGILIAATHIPLGIPFTKEIELNPNYEPVYEEQL